MNRAATVSAPVLPTVAQVRAYRRAMAVNDRVSGQAARDKSAAALRKLEGDLTKRGLSVAEMDAFDLDWSGDAQIVVRVGR